MLGVSILAGVLSGTAITPCMVQASSIIDEISDTETTKDFAEDTSYSLLRGSNLNYGTAKIKKLSSTEVNIYGLTQCHHECDNVYLYLYLEQKVDGNYGTYRSWRFETTNASNLDKSINVKVPSGYYYRLRTYHAAKDGTKESTTALTQGIKVS